MSSEQFDKRIKNKLESVRPAYEEAAWKNFRKLLPLPWYVAFYREYKGWLYSSVCTIAVITSTYLYYNQRKENQELNAKITTLNTQISENQKSPKDQLILAQPDTNRTTQKTLPIRPALPEVPQGTATAALNKNNSNVNNPVAQQALAEKTLKAISQKREANKLARNTPAEKTKAGQLNSRQQNIDGRQTPAEKSLGNVSNGENAAKNPLNSGVATPPAANNVNADSLGKKKLAASGMDTAKNDTALATFGNNKAATDSVLSQDKFESAKTTAPKKSDTGLSGLHARFGVASDFNGAPKFALGPALEVFISSKFSLNTGVFFATPQETRLSQPYDYNMATGKKFEDVYRPHIPHNDRIRDIKLRTSVIRMPIALYYYFPAMGKLSFLTMAGTKLDLSVYESVEFKSSFQGAEQLNRFETKPRSHTFNELFYGVGVQYKYGRLAGQASPYFNWYFRDQDNFNRPGKFGLNVSLKFDLKK